VWCLATLVSWYALDHVISSAISCQSIFGTNFVSACSTCFIGALFFVMRTKTGKMYSDLAKTVERRRQFKKNVLILWFIKNVPPKPSMKTVSPKSEIKKGI
jgi:hypothetical protein